MNQVLKYSLLLLVVIATVIFGVNIFSTIIIETFDLRFGWRLILGLVESLVSATILTIISINTFPVIRELMITMRRLIRFDNLSHPLLVRLSQEAPSTYHHSIMVANLAHRGAKAIAADPILTRVGAYYHDIGKLADPDQFSENQLHQPFDQDSTRHHLINPKDNARIIIKHVQDGVKLARDFNLPAEIINFIPQHHGTSVAKSFYFQAREAGLKVRKQDFRYPGPKPLSKETAIVMLADGIESKIRAVAELDENAITQTIDEILADKLDDDQLELSGLNAKDLTRLRQSFFQTIRVMTHRRVKYPTP